MSTIKKNSQQLYIEESRKAEEYKELLALTNSLIKKELNITASNISFLTAPSKHRWFSGTMYQVAWHSKEASYVTIFSKDCKHENVKDVLSFIESYKNILLDPYSDDEQIKGYIERLGFISITFKIYEFYELLNYTKYKNIIHYCKESMKVICTDKDSSIFNQEVHLIGSLSPRSHNCQLYILKENLEDTYEYWIDPENIKLI